MRKLNAKQKKLIRDWIEESNWDRKIVVNPIDSMPYELYQQLVQINDFETINQDIARYIGDLYMDNPQHNPLNRWD